MSRLPCGIWILEKLGCCSSNNTVQRNVTFRWLVFLLTFATYTAYHASRKPISVVKNVLRQNCDDKTPPGGVNVTADPDWCDWRPFEGEDANTLLGFVDSSFLFSYAIAMFFSGMLADRTDLRYFLAGGMLLSALFTAAFGAAFYLDIHSLAFFIFVQIFCGVFQASGWPGVVTVMGNWNGKSKRGLIFGIWNSHTSVGNILGSLMASVFVSTQWGLSFIVPGVVLALVGIVNFLFLPPYPAEVGCDPPSQLEETLRGAPRSVVDYGTGDSSSGAESAAETKALTSPQRHQSAGYGSVNAPTSEGSCDELAELIKADGSDHVDSDTSTADDVTKQKQKISPAAAPPGQETAVSFFEAIRIPGVLPFSVCLFFAKLVSYTWLYWLPSYLSLAADYTASESANLSTLFDMGGILGGILAGLANDWTGTPGIVCVVLLIVAIPMMFVYQIVATLNHTLNMLLLVVVGILVNGPYALITTAVSADLGTSLRKNAKALATVTSIIDGTGSVGAALGPLLAGAVSNGDNWVGVFVILMCSDVIAVVSLGLVLRREVRHLRHRWQHQRLIEGDTVDSA